MILIMKSDIYFCFNYHLIRFNKILASIIQMKLKQTKNVIIFNLFTFERTSCNLKLRVECAERLQLYSNLKKFSLDLFK